MAGCPQQPMVHRLGAIGTSAPHETNSGSAIGDMTDMALAMSEYSASTPDTIADSQPAAGTEIVRVHPDGVAATKLCSHSAIMCTLFAYSVLSVS